jgi:hypothetical protein
MTSPRPMSRQRRRGLLVLLTTATVLAGVLLVVSLATGGVQAGPLGATTPVLVLAWVGYLTARGRPDA